MAFFPSPPNSPSIAPDPSLSDFLKRDSQLLRRREDERLTARPVITDAESQELTPVAHPKFFHPTPREFLETVPPPDPAPAADFIGRSDQLVEKRRDCARQKAAACASDDEQPVIYRWYRETPSTAPRVPLLGCGQIPPGSPSFVERERVPPPPPPREPCVMPPSEGLRQFFAREGETISRRRCDGYTEPKSQFVYTTPRSHEIIENHRDHEPARSVPMTVYSYRPDMSLTAASRASGLPLVLVEAQGVVRDVRRFASAGEDESVGQPQICDRRRMEELALKSKNRAKPARAAAASMPVEREDVDFQPIGEKNRKDRRKREEARKKKVIAFGFKRRAAT
jgi:hypothetical protein